MPPAANLNITATEGLGPGLGNESVENVQGTVNVLKSVTVTDPKNGGIRELFGMAHLNAYKPKDNKPFICPEYTNNKNNTPLKSGQVFKMMDEDGNTRLFHLAETANDDSENERFSDRDNSGDDQIWARYDDASSESDGGNNCEHSPDSYCGSQYTSDSNPDERTGFMLDYDANSELEDYTNLEIPDQFAGVRDGSDSESEYELCI
ncbi:hypothetical protein L218DRAFT_946954 [Marasmius fiardii PR-910]|nr:hypothetical protein L218DRAFT_946954 [Marasmius fiardii PR-910]